MHESNSWFIETGEACLRPKPSPSMRAMGHIELSWLSLVTNFLNSPVETDFDGLALGVNPPKPTTLNERVGGMEKENNRLLLRGAVNDKMSRFFLILGGRG